MLLQNQNWLRMFTWKIGNRNCIKSVGIDLWSFTHNSVSDFSYDPTYLSANHKGEWDQTCLLMEVNVHINDTICIWMYHASSFHVKTVKATVNNQ
jgi:hypothetical protein